MLVVKIALLAAALFLMSLVEARYHFLSRVLRSSGDRLPRAWESREEHREESREESREDRYFEQCRFVNAWKEHLGYVSVLAFLDPAWQYSFRQAVMLELLSSRLRKSGFPDIRFFMISPFADSMENDKNDDDLEIEMWREIGAKHLGIDSLVDHDFLRSNKSEITFLRDDPQSRMWERFCASRNQVIILDRCGKLTYHVIVPWSMLFFPYVKAAILSTYMEDPCGGCDPNVHRAPSREEHVVRITKITDEKKANLTQSKTDANVDAIWTTESLENATQRRESSSEEGREASTASFIPLEITTETDRPIVSTESPTESATHQEDQGNSTNSEDGDTKNDSTPADEETTTTSDLADESRDRNTISENAERFGENAFLPLRIIMYAPHLHKNDKKHTHLILKTGDPDFHEHPDSEIDVASPTVSWRGADSHVASSKEWGTTEADEKHANQNYTFDKDESPGLYGEVLEHWMSYEESDINDRNETVDDTYNNSTASYNEEEISNTTVANLTEGPNVDENSADPQNIDSNTIESSRPIINTTINTNNQVEAEQYKLIEHYKKLLPWIDYILSK